MDTFSIQTARNHSEADRDYRDEEINKLFKRILSDEEGHFNTFSEMLKKK